MGASVDSSAILSASRAEKPRKRSSAQLQAEAEYRKSVKEAETFSEIQNSAVPRWPLAVPEFGEIALCRPFLRNGKGMRQVCGGLDPLGIESVQVAVSFITVNAPLLASSFGQPAISRLYNKYMDVNVTFSELDLARQGPSAGACAALALALLLGANLEGRVAVSGCIDLRGRVLPVGGIRGKIANARKDGVTMLLLPEWSLELEEQEGQPIEEGWESQEEVDFARDAVHGVDNFVELLQAAVKGFTPPQSVATLLDSTRVGVGRCLGLIKDEVRDLQVQSCYVESGDREVLMTVNLSSVSKECVTAVVDSVEASLPAIAARLKMPPETRLQLIRRGFSIHVHLEHGFRQIKTTYVMGAIYMWLVSLMTGRRAEDDVTIFGDVASTGIFSSGWDLTAEFLDSCRRVGHVQFLQLALR